MHIDNEVLKHLRAKEDERQREIKLRAESLDRYIETSKTEMADVLNALGAACRNSDLYRRQRNRAVAGLFLMAGIAAYFIVH